MTRFVSIEDIAYLTRLEKEKLSKAMFNPIRCGGCHYDDKGRAIYIHGGKSCTPKEHNDIIRKANPLWSEEALKTYLLDEDQ